jgi:uncharacterized protein (DUF1330 family)
MIDLSNADVNTFEAYEEKVLALVPQHGGRLEMRLRALDGRAETHLLYFPDERAFEHYREDPRRLALTPEWERSGAKSEAKWVELVRF